MTINLPGVIKTLGTNLYSDPSVSIRELIQNANDTCIVRQADDSSFDPNDSEIHVRFDPWHRTLTVEDNGAGMTEEEVKEFLTVIGSSKTELVRTNLEQMGQAILAERLIGRFGLGLLSAFIIGDRVEFVTLSYKEGAEPIWWECDGGQEYKMGPAESKTTPGTQVTVYVNPKHGGMLKDDKLTELIHTYADLLTVPIYLDPLPNPVNVMKAPWDIEASETEYREFVMNHYRDESILGVIPVDVNENDGEFKVGGVLFIPKQPMLIYQEYGDLYVYVRRMFICKNERSLVPEWAKFVRGIISTHNLKETASREAILRDENFERVQKTLGKIILDYLAQVSTENPRLFKEIVTNHNLVIKAWALVSDELFEKIKDIVLFTSDAGMINLPNYFEKTRYSKALSGENADKRYIFYFTTPGGAGQHATLFAAKGLRVINADKFPDETFLQKYAKWHNDVILKRLDVGGSFIFEELEAYERKWAELEDEYNRQRIEAKVVRFVPEDIPTVLIFPESEEVTDQVDELVNDPNLSPQLKTLVRDMWEERQKRRKERLTGGGTLYVNSNNPVIQKLADSDLSDPEIQDIMAVIYHNALMLSTQGARAYLPAESAKKVFESNNRTIATLMNKIYEVRELQTKLLLQSGDIPVIADTEELGEPIGSIQSIPQKTEHITCFVTLPFQEEYEVVLDALRDVLEVAPYFWEVVRDNEQYFASDVPHNVGQWIARAHCFIVEISECNENTMMELGYMYWSYPDIPLLLLQREGTERRMANLGERIRVSYPWEETPNRSTIVAKLKEEIKKHDRIKGMKGEKHFLSERIMQQSWIPKDLAKTLSEQYETVEDLLADEPNTIKRKARAQEPIEVIIGIVNYLCELCGLPKPN
jgi:molecular chaperone HtpG